VSSISDFDKEKLKGCQHNYTARSVYLCKMFQTQRAMCRLKYFKVQIIGYIKDKAAPLQAWTGPKGSRKLRFPDYVTMAQDGGKVVSLTLRSLLPAGNTPGTHFC
jgi:hypothetical protein